MNYNKIYYLTDCTGGDNEAFLRLQARFASVTQLPLALTPLSREKSKALLEVALEVVGILECSRNSQHGNPIIIVNCAPRGNGNNGDGFHVGYFKTGGAIITTALEEPFKLFPYLGIDLPTIRPVKDIAAMLTAFHDEKLIDEWEVATLKHTQFRSLEYAPRLARLAERQGAQSSLWRGFMGAEEGIEVSIDAKIHAKPIALYIDKFGNIKTSIVYDVTGKDKVLNKHAKKLMEQVAEQHRLKILPSIEKLEHGKAAIFPGSSGYGCRKFCEIMVGNESAAGELEMYVGKPLLK